MVGPGQDYVLGNDPPEDGPVFEGQDTVIAGANRMDQIATVKDRGSAVFLKITLLGEGENGEETLQIDGIA
jgi:hypothetical protein